MTARLDHPEGTSGEFRADSNEVTGVLQERALGCECRVAWRDSAQSRVDCPSDSTLSARPCPTCGRRLWDSVCLCVSGGARGAPRVFSAPSSHTGVPARPAGPACSRSPPAPALLLERRHRVLAGRPGSAPSSLPSPASLGTVSEPIRTLAVVKNSVSGTSPNLVIMNRRVKT